MTVSTPRRTYAQLQERAKAKAEKELREAERRRVSGVSGVTVSTMAFSLMVGYSTKSIETWRQGEHWSNDCAVGYTGGSNHKVRYSLDCLRAGLAPRAAAPTATTPFGVALTRPFLGFATFESAVLVDEPWVVDDKGRVVDHALVVPDEVLDEALEHDCVRERTLVHLLLQAPWADLAVHEGYRQVLNMALANASDRAFAAYEQHLLDDSIGPPSEPARRRKRLGDDSG